MKDDDWYDDIEVVQASLIAFCILIVVVVTI